MKGVLLPDVAPNISESLDIRPDIPVILSGFHLIFREFFFSLSTEMNFRVQEHNK